MCVQELGQIQLTSLANKQEDWLCEHSPAFSWVSEPYDMKAELDSSQPAKFKRSDGLQNRFQQN